MGAGPRKMRALGTPHGACQRILCERLPNRGSGQGSLNERAGSSRVKSWSYFSLESTLCLEGSHLRLTRADPIRLPLATSRGKDWECAQAGQKELPSE